MKVFVYFIKKSVKISQQINHDLKGDVFTIILEGFYLLKKSELAIR